MPKAESKESTEKRARPVHEISAGFIRAAIWENATESGPRHNVTLVRIYPADDGWKRTTSFGERDLVDAIEALVMAQRWVREKLAERTKEAKERSEGESAGQGARR